MNSTRAVPVELTPEMDAVLRNEKCVYGSAQSLYDALLSAAPPTDAAQGDDAVLPCDVRVAPATTISAGVAISTLLSCIELRRGSGEQHKFTRAIEERDANARDGARWRKLCAAIDLPDSWIRAVVNFHEDVNLDSVGLTALIDVPESATQAHPQAVPGE